MKKGRNMEKEQLYKEYYPKVLRYVSSKINRVEEAEDLAQNVFVKVFQNYDSFDESKASISTWIYTITHNTVINYYKSMKFRQVVDIPENYSEEVTEDFVEGLVAREMQGKLADALCKLDEDKRDLIILHYYSGHTLKEISELMKKPYGQIKRLHAKALGVGKDV